VVDPASLRVARGDGTEPLAIHHYTTKPWLEPTHHGVYSQLLRRLLIGPDVVVKVDQAEIPQRFRPGLRAWLARKRTDLPETYRWHVSEPIAKKIRGLRD
jgi:hypothetical protein